MWQTYLGSQTFLNQCFKICLHSPQKKVIFSKKETDLYTYIFYSVYVCFILLIIYNNNTLKWTEYKYLLTSLTCKTRYFGLHCKGIHQNIDLFEYFKFKVKLIIFLKI